MKASKRYPKTLLPILLFFLSGNLLFATHNRAGEITVDSAECESLTIWVTITTYTKTTSVDADRDSLEICWGDGECTIIGRTNGGGNGEPLENNIKRNYYRGQQ